jgi:hypothetical protein
MPTAGKSDEVLSPSEAKSYKGRRGRVRFPGAETAAALAEFLEAGRHFGMPLRTQALIAGAIGLPPRYQTYAMRRQFNAGFDSKTGWGRHLKERYRIRRSLRRPKGGKRKERHFTFHPLDVEQVRPKA